jgi:dipeptidyl aminopeptidase/acylaminoacyl peptidase
MPRFYSWFFVLSPILLIGPAFIVPTTGAGSRRSDKGPSIFAEGIISTGKEFGVTFTSNETDVYFTRSDSTSHVTHIMHSHKVNGAWSLAKPVEFSSSTWFDLDPALSPDGNSLFFVSTRLAPGKDATKKDMDIWVSRRLGTGWGEPQPITPVNSIGKEGSPTVDRHGNMYFFSDRGNQANVNAIYVSRFVNGQYDAPAKLGREINAGPSDTSPSISPDGNTMLFYSTRQGGRGKADLYVSFFKHGRWSEPENLGDRVNTPAYEYNPTISPDGKTLYFGRDGRVWFIPVAELGLSRLKKAWK